MSVKLSPSLPTDDRNGFSTISNALLDEPEAVHLIIAVVDCTKITTNVTTGDTIPTARIQAVEAFPGKTTDAAELRRLWRRAYERRTGKVELPLEIEQEIDALAPDDDDHS